MLKKLKGLLRRDPEQFRIPRSVQEVIPIRTVWKSGIFLVGSNRYSRTWQFSDINYALAGEEDQKSMLLGYSGLLNLCDSNASTKFSVVTRKLNRRDFEDYIMIPYANDGHDHYRREYNAMLLEKASHASGMIRDLYITVTVTRKSYKDAESYFVRAGAEFTLALSRLGSRCTELDMMDRLRALHGFYRHGEEADFHFDPALSMKLGHSFQDYICPDSFEFDRDHFRMGDRYGRVLFLKDYAAYLRDDILSELSGIDRPMILSIDVVPIPMDKAIWDSESRLLGVERNIVDFLRKQQANNNFSGTVPYDMEKQRAEMKEFLDDLTIRDQRMMLGMLTLVHTADSKEQLDADTDYIMNFSEMKMAIRLDRSYIEEALNVDTYHGMVRLVRIVLAITLGFEAAGAIISFFVFRKDYSPLHAVGISIFHSIAAFNNAGFDNLGGMHNLIPYKDNILLNITTDVLVIVGGIGFLVLVDIVKQKSFKKLCLHSKVAISMTAVLLIGGTLILKATENITWMGAFFQSMTTRTAGFSTYNIGNFSKAGLFAMCILMFIGASPGSTGGGVKTTTIFVMIQALKCMGRKKSAHAFKRSISEENISKAFMITVLSAGIYVLLHF